jgi:hypothetical protein
MQITSRSSRRAFVIGGGAAAACLGPLAVAQLGEEPPLPGDVPPAPPAQSEVAEWESLVGAHFLVACDAGNALARLITVERPSIDPERPAGLARFQPFVAWFEMDAHLAPCGQQSRRVTHPTKGSGELFLSRGRDEGGKTVLLALFN